YRIQENGFPTEKASPDYEGTPVFLPLRGRKDLRGLVFAKPPLQIQERGRQYRRRIPLSCRSKRLGCASPGPAFSPARGEKDIEHSRRHPFAPRRCPYAIALSWQARP